MRLKKQQRPDVQLIDILAFLGLIRAQLKPAGHHSTIIFGGLRGPLIVPLLCRETQVSHPYDRCFFFSQAPINSQEDGWIAAKVPREKQLDSFSIFVPIIALELN